MRLAEFVAVTGFNAGTLGIGLVVVPWLLIPHSRVWTVVLAHSFSAAVSYLFCRFVIWRSPAGADALARAVTFFALAAASAAASVLGVVAIHARSGTAAFVLLNYIAVGCIAVIKFALQRRAMTADRHRVLFRFAGEPSRDRVAADPVDRVGYRVRPEATNGI